MSKGMIAGYIRVSTDEQKIHGISIDSQEAALRQFAIDNEYDIEIYSDAGISAQISYKKRPALLRMIADCKAGKIQLICVTKLDRFFRSVKDYYKVFDQISTPWRAIWEDYETETANGQFKVNLFLSLAEMESKRTGERIRAVNQYKRDLGEYVGNLPFGYKWEHEGKKKRIVKDDNAPIVDMIIDVYKRTLSLSATHQDLKAAGYGSVSKYIIKNIVSNDFYCGIANQEQFEAYIAPEDIELLHTASNRHTRAPKEKHFTYLFTGLLKCPKCGCNMLCVNRKDSRKEGRRYIYYRCSRSFQYQCNYGLIAETTIERLLMSKIDSIIAPAPQIKAIKPKGDKDIAKQINSLKSRLKRLADMYEMGDIEKGDYIEKRDGIKLEIIRMESIQEPSENIPQLPTDWRGIYFDLDKEHKKVFWQKIIKNAVISEDKENIDIIFL